MHRTITALALALCALVPAAAQAADGDPEWVKWNGALSVEVNQDSMWEYHDEWQDSCSSNTIKTDGDGEETLTARTIEGDNPISIYMHVKTGETFIASPLGRPSGTGNSLMLKAPAATRRTGHIDNTVIGTDIPACGGSDHDTAPPKPDCGLKRHKMFLSIKFNGAFENTTVRNALDLGPDPLYKNCPNYAPNKSPNLILEFKRKQVIEGGVNPGSADPWFFSIKGEAKQWTNTTSLSAMTRLQWRALIYRYGDPEYVAGPGIPWPVPPPGGRSAEEAVADVAPVLAPAPAAAPAVKKPGKKLRVRKARLRSS